MANISASGGAGSRGTKLLWNLVFDDVANTVMINATHGTFTGGPAPDPQQAGVTLQINSGAQIALDLLTGQLTPGGLFDGTAGNMLNTGVRTRTGVRLKVSTDRAQAIQFTTLYQPPA